MGLFSKKTPEGDGSQTKSEADLLVERLGATIDEKLKPVREQVETITAKWNAIEAEANRSTNEEAEAARRSAENNLTPEEKSALETKKAFVLNVLTNARVTEEDVIREVRDKWPTLVPRFREVMNGIPFDEKSKANYADRCRNAVKLIVGEEAMKGGLKQDSTSGKFFLEDAGTGKGGDEGSGSRFDGPEFEWIDERSGRRLSGLETLAKLKIDPKEFEEFVRTHGGVV